MKYNRAEIFKAAWELKRKNEELKFQTTFGDCLKSVWKDARHNMEYGNDLCRYIIPDEKQEVEEAPKKAQWGWRIPLDWVIRKEVYRYQMVDGMPFFTEDQEEACTKKAVKIQGEWFPRSIAEYVKVAA